MAGVVARGGYVTAPSGPDDVHRVNGVYGVSRCLGNVGAEGAAGLSHEPDFVVHARQPEDRLLLVASDGVWDFVDVNAVVRPRLAPAGVLNNESLYNTIGEQLARCLSTCAFVFLAVKVWSGHELHARQAQHTLSFCSDLS